MVGVRRGSRVRSRCRAAHGLYTLPARHNQTTATAPGVAMQYRTQRAALALAALLVSTGFDTAAAQGPGGGGGNRQPVQMRQGRIDTLYVSDRPEDHPVSNYANALAGKAR